MGLNANKQSTNTDRVAQPSLESDVYPAYLVQLIDLGVQPQRPYEGKEKAPVQEIMLTYELSDCFMVDEDGKELEDKPRWVSETFPFHGLFADNAKSTKRYRAFDPDDSFDGDFSKAVGMPCNVTIVINKKGDKTYENVANVAPMSARKAAGMNEIKNPTKTFDLESPDLEVFNKLPKWIRDKITSNLHFEGSPLQKLLKEAPAVEEKKEEAPKKRKAEPVVENEAEDNPY